MTTKDYPPTLYSPGNSPLQNRSFNHNCKLNDFREMMDAVGETVFNDIMNTSQVGVILKLASSNYMWTAKTVHNFLTNQIAVDKKYEMWSLIGGRPLRFSLHEFEEITHLNCDMIDDGDKWDIDHTEFWRELGVKINKGPSWNELQAVFARCKIWPYHKRKMVGLLFILSVGIYGIHRNSRIPLMAAKRVLDPEAFERYPWGRESFYELITSIKVASFEGDTYTIHGCVHALLIWGYESVPILGEKFGNRKEDVDIPLLRWGSSRTRYILEDVLEAEKKTSKDNKIRVRHLLPKPLDEMYPVWLDETDDKKVDNMIRDICYGNLDESFWDISKAVVKTLKRKTVVQESVHDSVEKNDKNKDKRQKRKKLELKADKESEMNINLIEVKKEKQMEMTKIGSANDERFDSAEKSDIMKLLENLVNKFDVLETHVRDRFTAMENKIDVLDRNIRDRLTAMENRLRSQFPKIKDEM